ncbi:MAG: hypothetical protein ABSG86_24270, partial [Thermoguttaceae bacterium]
VSKTHHGGGGTFTSGWSRGSRGGGSEATVPARPAAADARGPSSLTGIRMMLGCESSGSPTVVPTAAAVAEPVGPAATTAEAGTAPDDPAAPPCDSPR